MASPALTTFLDGIPALAWSALPDGSVDFVNRPFCDYTGLPSEQLYGSAWKLAVHEDDIQHLEDWWRGLERFCANATAEVRLRRFDGEYRWFQIAAGAVRDGQGTL